MVTDWLGVVVLTSALVLVVIIVVNTVVDSPGSTWVGVMMPPFPFSIHLFVIMKYLSV